MLNAEDIQVRMAQRGDRAAFEELVRRTSRLVFARLYLETGDTHLAEDLLQETLWTAYRSLEQLEEPGKFRAWLLRIAQNIAIDAARRGSRQKRGAEPAASVEGLRLVPAPDLGPDAQAEREELRQKVLAVLRSLPEEYRLPLTLRYLAGADYETIEMQMGVSNGSLRGLLHRGMKLLRAELQPLMGELVPPSSGVKEKKGTTG
ncbi:MAG: sigma-70 family RNA polymerase sigma factor [Planctomycetes bacterium]|nr:sigma-70 family RNA polymerase sigma factor [Planctomycetota bacterium]